MYFFSVENDELPDFVADENAIGESMAYGNSNSFVKGTPPTRGKAVKNGLDFHVMHKCCCCALWHMSEAV